MLHRVGTADPVTETVTVSSSPATMPAPAPAPSMPPELATAFEQLSAETDARIGLAYAPLDNPQQAHLLGQWSTGPAWSTIKVPLSIALMRRDGRTEPTSSISAAITESSNAAAEQVWEALGAHKAAAAQVESVLADSGPPVPQVTSEVTRPGFSAFGQTEWSLTDQTRFLAFAACDPRDTSILDLMGEVVSAQRWGLGTINSAKIKGGWGPGRDGQYLVRQYGLIPTPQGHVAVAIAAVANSGGFADGTATLSQMATWLQKHRDLFGGSECRRGVK
jgi:hypothetical protein